jgi:2,3-dihydroxybiphenyl 1,2-dioxygenase
MMVSNLGYVGFKVADVTAFSDFAAGVLGLMPVEAPPGQARFRMDAQAWRIGVETGEEDDLDYVGFEAPDRAALEAIAARLRDAGCTLGQDDADLAAARGVSGIISCRDPQGLRVEIYFGPTERNDAPFVSPVGVQGFVAASQGLGHVVLTTGDIDASRRFYGDVMGFRLSDTIRLQVAPEIALDLEFYRCNPRHHTLALVPVAAPKRLNHFMVQVESLDDVGFGLERAEAAGTPITATLGRHTNDLMVSFYARTPAGFEVEYGFGARTVDEATWRVVRHDRTSCWGHKRPAGH